VVQVVEWERSAYFLVPASSALHSMRPFFSLFRNSFFPILWSISFLKSHSFLEELASLETRFT
jgi:hypothetical protein